MRFKFAQKIFVPFLFEFELRKKLFTLVLTYLSTIKTRKTQLICLGTPLTSASPLLLWPLSFDY